VTATVSTSFHRHGANDHAGQRIGERLPATRAASIHDAVAGVMVEQVAAVRVAVGHLVDQPRRRMFKVPDTNASKPLGCRDST
jgi:hypothetical protein